MKYALPDRNDVLIPELKFSIPLKNGYTTKDDVKCIAKGPFLADFVWDYEREEYYCDRLYLARSKVRLDDVAGFKPLCDAAAWWAEENDIGHGEWEAVA